MPVAQNLEILTFLPPCEGRVLIHELAEDLNLKPATVCQRVLRLQSLGYGVVMEGRMGGKKLYARSSDWPKIESHARLWWAEHGSDA